MQRKSTSPVAANCAPQSRRPAVGEGLTYEIGLSPQADGAAVAALLEEFVLDEAGTAPLRLDAASVRPVMLPWALSLLQYADMCVVARAGDDRQLVGVAINLREAPPYDDKDDGWLNCFYADERVLAHQRFVQALESRVDLCERYGVDALFVIDTLVCARSWRQRGIARRLVELSLIEAARRGYKAAAAFGSSAHSQRVFESVGFECVVEASVDEHPNAALFDDAMRNVHGRFVLYGRRLSAPPEAIAAEQQSIADTQ